MRDPIKKKKITVIVSVVAVLIGVAALGGTGLFLWQTNKIQPVIEKIRYRNGQRINKIRLEKPQGGILQIKFLRLNKMVDGENKDVTNTTTWEVKDYSSYWPDGNDFFHGMYPVTYPPDPTKMLHSGNTTGVTHFVEYEFSPAIVADTLSLYPWPAWNSRMNGVKAFVWRDDGKLILETPVISGQPRTVKSDPYVYTIPKLK